MYTIRIREQVTPREVVRKNPATGKDVLRPAPIPQPVNPQSYVQPIYSPLQGDPELIYESDPVGRTELWEDTAGTATMADIDAACPGFRLHKEKLIRMEGALKLTDIAAPYSSAERETWPYQREECLAYSRDTTALTPFCDAVATRRGIPRELFLAKVKENMDLFSAASAQILGAQQALIDQIYAATTIEGVIGVEWV